MNKLIVITGPTAVGKTNLGLELAKKFSGEIVSADSRQVYKYLDIGTGKDIKGAKFEIMDKRYKIKAKKKDERSRRKWELGYYKIKGVKIWGLDIVLPDYHFNVSDYVEYAIPVISDIWAGGKLPIIVGGSGQYIKELLCPSETLHVPPDPGLRQKLSSLPVNQLRKELQKADFSKWERMNQSDRNNPRRLVRAIEVALSSPQKGLNPFLPRLGSLIIGLTAPKEILYQRINDRIKTRLQMGMAKERKKLQAMGYRPDALGYKEESIEQWQKDEHAYARRQLTYQKKLPGITWFDIADPTFHNKVLWLIKKFVSPMKAKKRNMPTIWRREKK